MFKILLALLIGYFSAYVDNDGFRVQLKEKQDSSGPTTPSSDVIGVGSIRKTLFQWADDHTVYPSGMLLVVSDDDSFKIADGSKPFADLSISHDADSGVIGSSDANGL